MSGNSPLDQDAMSGIPSADNWRTDSPPFGQSPIWQFVWVQGEQYHSERRWFRHGWGLATIRVAHAPDHYRGFRQSDIEAICKDNGIDFSLGPIIVGWLPASPPALLEAVERPSLKARDDGEWGKRNQSGAA